MGSGIRLFRPSDWPEVRRICFETGHYGRPAADLIDDPELFARLWLAYYARFEADLFFIAERDGRVAGYLTGCRDTARFSRRFVLRVAPAAAGRILAAGHWRRGRLWKLLFRLIFHRAAAAIRRTGLLKDYPAHAHLNLEAEARGQGIGAALLEAFLERMRREKVPGVHVGAASPGGKSFFQKAGFQIIRRFPAVRLAPGDPEEVWILAKELLPG